MEFLNITAKDEESLFIRTIDLINNWSLENKSKNSKVIKVNNDEWLFINQQIACFVYAISKNNTNNYHDKYINYFQLIDYILLDELKPNSSLKSFFVNLLNKNETKNDKIKSFFNKTEFTSFIEFEKLINGVSNFHEMKYLIEEFEKRYNLDIFSIKESNFLKEEILFFNYIKSNDFCSESLDCLLSNKNKINNKLYYELILDNLFVNTTNINKPNDFFNLLTGKHKKIFFDYIHKLNKDNELAAKNYDDELTLNTHASIFCMLNFLQLYKFENLNKLKEIINVINVIEANCNSLPMKIFLNNDYNKMTLPMNEQNFKNAEYLDENMNIFSGFCNNLNLNDEFYLCDMYSGIFEEKVWKSLYYFFTEEKRNGCISLNELEFIEKKLINHEFIENNNSFSFNSMYNSFFEYNIKNISALNKNKVYLYLEKIKEILDEKINNKEQFEIDFFEFIDDLNKVKNDILLISDKNDIDFKNIDTITIMIDFIHKDVLKTNISKSKNKKINL